MPNKKFRYASFFTDGLAAVKEKDKIGFINTKGSYLVQPSFDEIDIIYNFTDYALELYAVKKDGKWGFMDKKGKAITGFIYGDPDEEYGSFGITDDLIAVSHDNKWGYINKSGKVVIPYTYDRVMRFSDGKAFVQLGDEKYYIDKNGQRKK